MYNGDVTALPVNLSKSRLVLAGMLGLLWLVACRQAPAPTPTPVPPPPTATVVPRPSPTPLPSSTPEPLAARVNGQPIRLADYEVEVARCQAAAQALSTLTPNPPSPPQYQTPPVPGFSSVGRGGTGGEGECPARALQMLIDQALILQASRQAGIAVTEAQVEAAVQATTQAAGGDAGLSAWLVANHWTPAMLRETLRLQLLAQALAEHALGAVPATAEQVHARHILVATEAEARDLRARLVGGADFAQLARTYSLDVTTAARGGDLGWFSRGQLLAPELEAAAFGLVPGGLSDVVHSALGYHIVQTLERDPARPLSLEQQAELRRQALATWLTALRAGAHVERFVDIR